MIEYAIDYQSDDRTCECCGETFKVSRGCVYTESRPVGIYLAAMHGCKAKGVSLAIGLL